MMANVYTAIQQFGVSKVFLFLRNEDLYSAKMHEIAQKWQ